MAAVALFLLSVVGGGARRALLATPMFVALTDAATAQLWATFMEALGSADVDSMHRLRGELTRRVANRAGDAILEALDDIGSGTGSSGGDGSDDIDEARCEGRTSTKPPADDDGSAGSTPMAQLERCTTLCSAESQVCCEKSEVP